MYSQQAFGKNNLLKLYTVLSVLSQIAFIVCKSGYLCSHFEGAVNNNLAKALPCSETALAMLVELPQIDFLMLQFLPSDYDIYEYPKDKATILVDEKILINAWLLHNNMDVSVVQQYCGG